MTTDGRLQRKTPEIPPPPPPPATSAPPAVVVQPRPPVPPPEPTWISLNRWAVQHNLREPQRLTLPKAVHFSLVTSNGAFVVQAGSTAAYWNRIEIRLGFAPQIIAGQIFLHSLDVKKNLEPLAQGYSAMSQTNRVIVIDPGHGGINAGTHSVADGRWEKELTLDWALRLAPLLTQKGWKVFLTRTNDVDVSLLDRVLFAELCHADFFLSLHFNSSGGSSAEASGLETFCITPTGMASTLVRDFPDDPRQIFPNNAFDEQNVQLAAQVHRALIGINAGDDRGVRRARFPTVLRGQRRPSALIEGGFLSNAREAGRIADPAHRQKLAEAVATALDTFVARPTPPPQEKTPVVVAENRKLETPIVQPQADVPLTNDAPVVAKPAKRRFSSPRNQ